MKRLQNNYTTPEQSKRLLELGVPADSADCYWNDFIQKPYVLSNLYSKGTFLNPKAPCWSVGRLNEIFKICSDNHIEIYDLDLEGTQIERAMQAFENYAKYNWLDFSKMEE